MPGAAEDWRLWRGSVFPNGDPPYSLWLRGTSYLSLWSAVSITALTQEVGFSQDAGALKKVRVLALLYFPKSSPQVRPHPKAAILAALQSLPSLEPGRQPLDCGEDHRFDAGSRLLTRCRGFAKGPSSRPFVFSKVFLTGPPTPQSGDAHRSPKFTILTLRLGGGSRCGRN